MRNAKQEDIDKFKKDHKLKTLGMPEFIAMGSHEIEQLKHRFIVLPRFGRDISKIFVEQNNKIPLNTVYRLSWQMVNVLEYIHTCTYVHGDIKGSNILLGFGKGGEEQAFLLDFGLACHYSTKDFKPDPKKMHNGTIEYTSRDAHHGVPTMRGDIEILAYNLIEWAGGKLPWVVKNLLNKPSDVQKSKEEFMKSTEKTLKGCFEATSVPVHIVNFFKYLGSMNHDTKPDYTKIRGILEAGIKELGQKNSGVLDFKAAKTVKVASSPQKKAKLSVNRPDFGSKTGKALKKTVEATQPGPSKITEATTKRTRGTKTYVEEASDDSDDEMTKKKKSQKKKPTTAKAVKSAEPDDVQEEESRQTKRNRERKEPVIDEESSEDEAPAKSPQKKPGAQKSPNRSTSKENHDSGESSVSPPLKKAKPAERKKEKSSKDAENTITLKSKTKSSKNKKTIRLNVNLDVSMNSDLVVVFNRKDKKRKKDDEQISDEEEAANSDENKPETPNRAGYYKGKKAKV